MGGCQISVGKWKSPGNPVFWPKPCPIFKISSLAVSFEGLSWVPALKKWNSVARWAHFLAQSWLLAGNQKKPRNWPKSNKRGFPILRLASMVTNIINLPQEKKFWKNIMAPTHNGEKRAPHKKPVFSCFLQKKTKNWKTIWSAQSSAFWCLTTYPKFVGFGSVLRE